VEDCEIILDCYSRNLKRPKSEDEFEACSSNNNKDWAHGRKHIFLSEGARQQLEQLRETRRQAAATKIQVFAAHLLFLLSVAVAFMYLHTGIFETVPRILLQGVHRNLCHKCLGQQIQDGLDVASDTVSYCCYCNIQMYFLSFSCMYLKVSSPRNRHSGEAGMPAAATSRPNGTFHRLRLPSFNRYLDIVTLLLFTVTVFTLLRTVVVVTYNVLTPKSRYLVVKKSLRHVGTSVRHSNGVGRNGLENLHTAIFRTRFISKQSSSQVFAKNDHQMEHSC
jgi:hypothetical protein